MSSDQERAVIAHTLRHGRVINVPYAVVDAALQFFLNTQVAPVVHELRFRWSQSTNGSGAHVLLRNKTPIAAIELRMVDAHRTLGLILAQTQDQAARQTATSFLAQCLLYFEAWFNKEQQRIADIAATQPQVPDDVTRQLRIPVPDAYQRPSVKAKPGRRMWREDVWAREAVAGGMEREAVYAEWLTRLSPERVLKDPRDSFRHAVPEERTE